MARSWWHKPALHGEVEERRATWLELFLDLVFIALIAKLSALLAQDVSGAGLGTFLLLFLPGWSIWLSMTVYEDRFETDDVSNRLAVLFISFTVAGMAVAARGFAGPGFVAFALFFVAARALIVSLWLRAGFHNPQARPVTTRYAVGFTLAITVWLAAILAPLAARPALVAAALIVDFATPGFTMRQQGRLPRLSASHLPERFGLFVIIVLGESVVSVVAVLARQSVIAAEDATAAVFVMLFAFSLWWLYFDHVAENPPLREPWRVYGFGLLHLPLMCSLTAVGAGCQAFIAGEGSGSPAISAMTASAAAITFFVIGALEFTTEPTAERRHPVRSLSVHWGAALGALAVGLAAGPVGTLPALVVLLALAAGQVVYGIGTRSVDSAPENAGGGGPL